jgi:hypothetical protein
MACLRDHLDFSDVVPLIHVRTKKRLARNDHRDVGRGPQFPCAAGNPLSTTGITNAFELLSITSSTYRTPLFGSRTWNHGSARMNPEEIIVIQNEF